MEKSEQVDRSAIASQGGDARDKALSAERKSQIASAAANARWAFPQSLAEGSIEFAGRLVSCAVLSTKLRVLTQETFLTTLGRAGKAKGGQGSRQMIRHGGLPPFLAAENLQRFIGDELRVASTPIVFRTLRGNRAYGYDAKLLPMVCEVYLRARDAHLEALKDAQDRRKKGENIEAKPVLLANQEPLVRTCDLLVRSMAREHIIALVDRATGYQEFEVRDEITKILEAYIAPHLMPFTLRFPDEFFRQVYHLHKWNYVVGNTKRPQYVGKFINKYIYEELPPGVLKELQKLNPVTKTGHRATQHHRRLTDTGSIHLDRQVTTIIALMSVSDDKTDFKAQFDKSKKRTLPRPTEQVALKMSVPRGTSYELFPPSEPVKEQEKL
jgi:P63C domain